METYSSFRTRSYCCFVEWLTTYSNQVKYVQYIHSDGREATSSVQTFSYCSSQSQDFSLFLIKLGGAFKIDLALSMFSLAKTVFTSFFLKSTLLGGETNTVVLEEAILEEEKSYPNLVQSEVDF